MTVALRRRPQGGKVADPAWCRQRNRLANAARRRQALLHREALGERYATKGLAYAAGDRTGYARAMHWFAYQVRRGFLTVVDRRLVRTRTP